MAKYYCHRKRITAILLPRRPQREARVSGLHHRREASRPTDHSHTDRVSRHSSENPSDVTSSLVAPWKVVDILTLIEEYEVHRSGRDGGGPGGFKVFSDLVNR